MVRVAHLFRAPKRRLPMQEMAEVRVLKDAGFEGCAHARPGGKRQVLLVDRETLADMQLIPGIIRENITTEGLPVNDLRIGQKLRIGRVQLEVRLVCEPCDQLEKVRDGLKETLRGKRGMLCRVLSGGRIRSGDAIEILA
ncbi:MAG: MOSC domain-containing protein [Candidatus Acidiferrum sp.]